MNVHLQRKAFDFILIDLEILVRYGCENLLIGW